MLVKYREGIILRIPLSSTNISSHQFLPSCKISYIGVKELISLAQGLYATKPQAYLEETNTTNPTTNLQKSFNHLSGGSR